jgi:glycerate kinase
MNAAGVRVLVAPDKFKGTLSARQAAEAVAAVAVALGASVEILPMADGGEGTVEAFGGANRVSTVTGPLQVPVRAQWRLGPDGTAVIESAAASGLVVAGGAEHNDPLRATTCGTGELIAEALDLGAREVIVGMGGSASTDGGLGALEALEGHLPFRPGQVQVITDVTTPLRDAAVVFGPQKGVRVDQIPDLTARLADVARQLRERFGADVWELPRTGASGGLSGGLAAAGASLAGGAELIADRLGLAAYLERCDLVVVGEGRFDSTSLTGKAPGLVIEEAARRGLPVLVIAGSVAPEVASIHPAVSLVDAVGLEMALGDPEGSVKAAAEQGLHEVLPVVRRREGR